VRFCSVFFHCLIGYSSEIFDEDVMPTLKQYKGLPILLKKEVWSVCLSYIKNVHNVSHDLENNFPKRTSHSY